MRSRRAAVLGSPISHSLSPVLHRAAYASLGLDWRYDALEVGDERGLQALFDQCDTDGDWAGLSLTMPLKKLVLPMLDEVSGTASATSAVNTVVFESSAPQPDVDGRPAAPARPRRVGHNTDVTGIVRAVSEAGVDALTEGLVLGGGATACSAVAALARLGARQAQVVVRSPERAADVVTTGERVGLVVHLRSWTEAASAGTTSGLVVSTVPALASDEARRLLAAMEATRAVLLDVAYDPWPTPVAQDWERRGGRVVGGFSMLLHQAVEQVRLMTGRTPDVAAMRRAGLAALAERR
ncbi:MAG TPA: shikimate dehydrogenase [Actinomycetales bacterium]|nr:shikimate dehydrogenase [Actinomycetales bacterium]